MYLFRGDSVFTMLSLVNGLLFTGDVTHMHTQRSFSLHKFVHPYKRRIQLIQSVKCRLKFIIADQSNWIIK